MYPTAHIEVARSAHAAWEYCGKTETRVEGPLDFGIPPAQLNKRGEKQKRNELLLSKGPEQAVRDGDIRIEEYAKVKHNIDLFTAVTAPAADLDELDNYWFYGPPGTGKSHRARHEFGEYYDKPLNKWWDDYKQQPTVIIDDVDLKSAEHAHLFKRWADKYAFTGETKGGTVRLRPRRIVVTSNYHPEDIFNSQDAPAIVRRFKIQVMNDQYKEDKVDEN